MEEGNEDGGGRVVCALQVVAVSGFLVEEIREMQQSCLGLCNACRDGVPMPLLKIKPGVPSGLLKMLCSGIRHAEGDLVLRVLPHFRVLSVELTFIRFGSEIEQEEAGPEGGGDGHGITLDINTVTWPEGMRNLNIYYFNRPVQEVVWPASLERLVFGRTTFRSMHYWSRLGNIFNQSFDGVHFPPGVREIFLGEAFDQSIDNVSWPEGLEKLSLPAFNQPIDKVRWPAGLKIFEFASSWQVEKRKTGFNALKGGRQRSFDQPIHTGLPAGLHTLWLSDELNQPIDTVVWPSGLVTIAFGEDFERSFKGIAWPSTLHNVFLVDEPFDYDESDLSPSCNVVIGVGPNSDSGDRCDDERYEYPRDYRGYIDTWRYEY